MYWFKCRGLNPHVVGRFFREVYIREISKVNAVLIPMWWGGFSELIKDGKHFSQDGLNPHVVGRFFRVHRPCGTSWRGGS